MNIFLQFLNLCTLAGPIKALQYYKHNVFVLADNKDRKILIFVLIFFFPTNNGKESFTQPAQHTQQYNNGQRGEQDLPTGYGDPEYKQ